MPTFAQGKKKIPMFQLTMYTVLIFLPF